MYNVFNFITEIHVGYVIKFYQFLQTINIKLLISLIIKAKLRWKIQKNMGSKCDIVSFCRPYTKSTQKTSTLKNLTEGSLALMLWKLNATEQLRNTDFR